MFANIPDRVSLSFMKSATGQYRAGQSDGMVRLTRTGP